MILIYKESLTSIFAIVIWKYKERKSKRETEEERGCQVIQKLFVLFQHQKFHNICRDGT